MDGMMSWFSNLFSRKSSDASWAALIDSGRETAAGISVSPEIALRCAPVFAAARLRWETIGSLPCSLYKRLPGGGKERADDHPLHGLVHDRANPWTAAPELIMQLEKDVITHGDGYAVANRSGNKVIELIRMKPGAATVEEGPDLEPVYRFAMKGGGQRTFRWQDVLHVASIDGLSPVRQCADAIALTISLERHAGRIFKSGGRPSGILKLRGAASAAALDRLRQSWESQYVGENAGKTLILEDGSEFEALSFKSVDLQFAEMRAFQVVEICRALGVPPSLVGDYSRATWSNSEQMAQAFLTFGILPRLKLWQGAINRLLSAEEQKTHFAEFTVDELVKADIAARFEAYSKAIASRILSPNEARGKENLAPVQGLDVYENPNTTSSTPATEPRSQSKRKS